MFEEIILENALYIVATPIGNLQDITYRALNVIKNVDYILAEDTKHTKKLLDFFNIDKKMIPYHKHNEAKMIDKVISDLSDKKIAIVSDAGTPLISDPGFKLVQKIHNNNLKVIPVPGACAAIAALCVSGINTDKFIFEGFLPVKEISKKKYLSNFINEERTIVFYEAPHRLLKTLESFLEVFGEDRLCFLGRELTKIYETAKLDTIKNLVSYISDNPPKGECVLVLNGNRGENLESGEKILNILLQELPVKQASKLASEITGISKSKLYKIALQR